MDHSLLALFLVGSLCPHPWPPVLPFFLYLTFFCVTPCTSLWSLLKLTWAVLVRPSLKFFVCLFVCFNYGLLWILLYAELPWVSGCWVPLLSLINTKIIEILNSSTIKGEGESTFCHWVDLTGLSRRPDPCGKNSGRSLLMGCIQIIPRTWPVSIIVFVQVAASHTSFLPFLTHTWHFADVSFHLWLHGSSLCTHVCPLCIACSSSWLPLQYSAIMTYTWVMRHVYILKSSNTIYSFTAFYTEKDISKLLLSLHVALAVSRRWLWRLVYYPCGTCHLYVIFLLRFLLFCDSQRPSTAKQHFI